MVRSPKREAIQLELDPAAPTPVGAEEVDPVLDVWKRNAAELRERLGRYREALQEVERHCPCGARPEALNTHPHVTSCPVARALHPDDPHPPTEKGAR